MSSEEFKTDARNGEEAFTHMLIKSGYAYIQWSDSEGCWDYYLWDDDRNYIDGGQFETDGEGHDIENAYDAMSILLYDDKGIYDINDESEVEFLDPEEHCDFEEFY